MKLSDYVALRLAKEVDTVFGYQGSSISHLIDSICAQGIRYVQNYHEQAAAFSACGYSEVYHKLGVAISCSGPGATNLITGIANAYYDSLPCLFISGQVSTKEFKINSSRQNGFQETNIIEIVRPITKYCVEITDPNQIAYELEKCINKSLSGRMGPTFISLPHNIQSYQIDVENLNKYKPECKIEENVPVMPVIETIKKSQRPLILIGGGAFDIKNNQSFALFRNKYHIPYVASLRGINNIENDDDYIGFIGIYGAREANLAVYASDLLIVLGSRLDGRQTGGVVSNFAPHAQIIHVDIDKSELNREVHADFPINTSCAHFFELIAPFISDDIPELYDEWHKSLAIIKEKCVGKKSVPNDGVNPYDFVAYFSSLMLSIPLVISTDVGQNQMWVAKSMKTGNTVSFLTSGGHGAMGYSLPAIIGAYYSTKNSRTLVAYMGDGGFQMNIQELEVIKRESIPVIIVVFVNNSLGLIRDYQSKALGNRLNGSVLGFSVPDLKKVASLYNLAYIKISNNDFSSLDIINYKGKSVLIEVNTSNNSTISPEIAYQRPIFDQSPFVDLSFISEITNYD